MKKDINNTPHSLCSNNNTPLPLQERKFKPTNIPWLGEIPEGWGVGKLQKKLTTIGSGTTPSENEKYYNGDILWLNTGDLNDDYITNIPKTITQKALDDYSTLKIFNPNDIVVAMYGATVGKIGILTQYATTNQACCVMSTNNEELYFKYLFYIFLSSKDFIISLSFGSGQPNINQGILKIFPIPLPPLEEQEEIARFLDEKCAGVDELVKNTKEAIDRLKEMKKSIITEAVTKGLEKNAKLKQTSIPWLGEIPEGWGVVRHKNYINLEKGKNPINLNDNQKGLPYIGASDFDNKQYTVWTTDIHLPKCTKGDILILWDGARAGIIDNGHIGVISSTMVKVDIKSDFQNQYYFWLSKALERYYIDMSNGTTIPHMSKEFVNNTTIPIPPLDEQEEIARFLDEKCAGVDEVIRVKEEVIIKLLEFKKSLIYEYVTGKKEVN